MTLRSQDPPCNHLLPLRLELGQDAGQRSDLHAVALADAVPDCAVCKPQTQLSSRSLSGCFTCVDIQHPAGEQVRRYTCPRSALGSPLSMRCVCAFRRAESLGPQSSVPSSSPSSAAAVPVHKHPEWNAQDYGIPSRGLHDAGRR